ncbi:MAG: ABC transporter permease [Elusimicrobiales bacterium]|nr:ABC transporter permease [Elusimicrobiales bacterium]
MSLDGIFSLALLSQTVRISVPYVLAALGATISETGGVVNIALEGLILTGAFCAVLGSHYSGNPWVGVMAAMTGGIFVSLIHAVVCIRFRANQIISGLAINILAAGATKFFLKLIFHSSSNSSRVAGLPHWSFFGLDRAPVIGAIVSDSLILAAALLVFASYCLIYKTPFGLRLRAVGEHPECAETLGVSVYFMRCAGVMLCGVLAALAGAWLAFDQHQFSADMSGGRGYIALTAMIFGKWNPLWAALAAALFGLAEAFQIQLQTVGVSVPTQFIQMIPYVLTVVLLAGVIGKSRAPAADGKPYPGEE